MDHFRECLVAQSALNAKRRGVSDADEADVRDAFKSLLDRRARPLFVEIACEAGLVVSGGLGSYALTLLTASPRSVVPGCTLMASGVIVCVFAAILKHADLR